VLQLERTGAMVQLSIRDNGRGVDGAAPTEDRPRGLGIVGMRARARSAGGELNIASNPGSGTLIEASFPYRAREEA
jgi:signal transduction histidine kinase